MHLRLGDGFRRVLLEAKRRVSSGLTNERGEGTVMCDKSIQLQHNQFVLHVSWEAQGMEIQTMRAV